MAPASCSSEGLDDPGLVAKAMARPLRSARLAGGSRALSLDELEYDDEPLSEDVLAAGAYQDAVADRVVVHELSDRTLDDEMPPGYDRRWEGF